MNLLSTKDVAKKMNCSRQHVCSLVKSQGLPCFRWGKLYKFNEEEVDKWIEERRYQYDFDPTVLSEALRDLVNHAD